MSQGNKNLVLTYSRKSMFLELENIFKSQDIHWTECRHASGDTPLHVAAASGNVPVLKLLLEKYDLSPTAVDTTNTAGKTALHEACQNAQPETVSYLLSKGANARAIKQADWTPLMLACTKKGKKALSCCQLLLEREGPALLLDKNKDGWNALHVAAREGDTKIVQELLQADVLHIQASLRSNNGRTPLHTAALHGCDQVVLLLQDSGYVDFNVKDSCGSTPIHDAVRSGSLETFTALATAGADLTVCNNEGYGILHMAAQTGQIAMLQYLMDLMYPIKINDINQKTTPLHCAVRAGQVESIQFLMEKGADPSVLDAWGRSCHDITPEKNADKIVHMLNNSKI